MLKKFLIAYLIILPFFSFSQSQDYPYDISYYDFVDYDNNKLNFYGDSSEFEKLFYKMDTLFFRGEGQIKIIQIGASHTQADIFSAQVRKRLQTFDYGYNAGRGYVFPFKMMKTNNPYDYKTEHTGIWTVCRNVDYANCELGITGISATTEDSASTFKIILKNNDAELNHSFSKIKLIHNTDSLSFVPKLDLDSNLYSSITYNEKGYTEFLLKDYYTEISFKLEKNSAWQKYFTMFGILLETDESGFIYHPMGINGASTKSWLKCDLFDYQLDVINPDLIVIDLGTNDGYTKVFDSITYEQNYKILIQKIKSVNSDIAIIAVVPNDCYLWKKRANPATEVQERILQRISVEENVAVWNKYEIMGGFNSSSTWYKNNLMAYDRVHFTNEGYQLLGNMFFNAFLQSYDYHLEKIKIKYSKFE